MFWVCETPRDAPFKKLLTVYLILLNEVSIQVCSFHSKLEDPNFLWAQLTPPFAQMLLGWVFPARPGLTSIICVLHCEAQWSNCFKLQFGNTGLTLPWWYFCGHYAEVTGDEGLGITWGSASFVCSAGQSGGAQSVGLQPWLLLRAQWADGAVLPQGFCCPGLLQWWDLNRLMTF